jgi:hypothetical protein
MGVGYALIFYVFGFLFLYAVVRAAVRDGIADADRRRERHLRSAETAKAADAVD